MVTLPLVYGPEITTSCYKGLLQEYVILCYGIPNKQSPLAVPRFSVQTSPLAPCGSDSSQSMVTSHSTEHDTHSIAYLISKQVYSILISKHTQFEHDKPNPKVWGLGNCIKVCRSMRILERERENIGLIWLRVTCLTLPLAAAQSPERRAPGDSWSLQRLTVAIENK
jgi:hypothetical protein